LVPQNKVKYIVEVLFKIEILRKKIHGLAEVGVPLPSRSFTKNGLVPQNKVKYIVEVLFKIEILRKKIHGLAEVLQRMDWYCKMKLNIL
jgi:uncharacterized membrane protein